MRIHQRAERFKKCRVGDVDAARIIESGLPVRGQPGDGKGHGNPVVGPGQDPGAVQRTAAVDDHAIFRRDRIPAHGILLPSVPERL